MTLHIRARTARARPGLHMVGWRRGPEIDIERNCTLLPLSRSFDVLLLSPARFPDGSSTVCREVVVFVRTPPQSLFALVFVGLGLTSNTAAAPPSVELAKKCAVATQKAFPPRLIGNPAAGTYGGSGPSERAYFNECIKNQGIVSEQKPAK
jgi:hypothetical protein